MMLKAPTMPTSQAAVEDETPASVAKGTMKAKAEIIDADWQMAERKSSRNCFEPSTRSPCRLRLPRRRWGGNRRSFDEKPGDEKRQPSGDGEDNVGLPPPIGDDETIGHRQKNEGAKAAAGGDHALGKGSVAIEPGRRGGKEWGKEEPSAQTEAKAVGQVAVPELVNPRCGEQTERKHGTTDPYQGPGAPAVGQEPRCRTGTEEEEGGDREGY